MCLKVSSPIGEDVGFEVYGWKVFRVGRGKKESRVAWWWRKVRGRTLESPCQTFVWRRGVVEKEEGPRQFSLRLGALGEGVFHCLRDRKDAEVLAERLQRDYDREETYWYHPPKVRFVVRQVEITFGARMWRGTWDWGMGLMRVPGMAATRMRVV